MGELMFHEVRADIEPFVQYRSRHGPEAVRTHFVLRDTHSLHGRADGAAAHGAAGAARAGKHVFALACQRPQLLENRHRLLGQRHDERLAHLHLVAGNAHQPSAQVYVGPFRRSQFAGAKEHQGRKFQRCTGEWAALHVRIKGSQQGAHGRGVNKCREVLAHRRRQ